MLSAFRVSENKITGDSGGIQTHHPLLTSKQEVVGFESNPARVSREVFSQTLREHAVLYTRRYRATLCTLLFFYKTKSDLLKQFLI